MTRTLLRPLVGLVAIVVAVVVVVLAANLFRGGFIDSVPVTVITQRAGLVMNPDAKVKVRGVQVGTVAVIEELPDGAAAIHLDMDPSRLDAIPANALVDIASPTVFGAKQVQFVFPDDPSEESLQAGQVVDARHVMVEVNTVFEQLTSVLSQVEPAKLNATLAAIASAVSGRGEKFGQMLSDLDAYLAGLEGSLPATSGRPAGRTRRAAGLCRCDARVRHDRRERHADQRLDRRGAVEPGRCVGERDRAGGHRKSGAGR